MPKQSLPSSQILLNESIKIVEYIYDEVLKQFDEFSEEKFHTELKLRRAANDIIFFAAQVAGNTTVDTSEYDLESLRKNLVTLKTMYIFAGKRFIELEPSIVIRVDKLIVEVDKEIDRSKEEVKRRTDEELEPWFKKYNLWKEMSDDKPNSKKD